MSNTYIRFAFMLCRITECRKTALSVRQRPTMSNKTHREIEERKIKVDNMEINFARVGRGDHPVLLLPGALGTIWTDFKPQIENLNADKFTIVAWDPPGYGKSRPPNRIFPDDFFQRDAAWAHNLMQNLGYSKFSLIGWSDGGITSLLLASMYPESICKMVVQGANAFLYLEEAKMYKTLLCRHERHQQVVRKNEDTYDTNLCEDYFKKMWSDLIDAILRLYEKQNGDLCKQALSKIKCPTLIVHGAKDAMVSSKHAPYLNQNIVNSKMRIFEKGAYNLHLRYFEEFNNLVTNFILDQSKI